VGAVAVAVLAALAFPGAALAAPPKPPMSTPTIACDVSEESSSFIDILVTAGSAPGAPAGFSIQWETAADFANFGWPADSSCPLDINGNPTCGASFCKTSFSGNANLSRYNLSAGLSVTVRIGELLLDNGASIDDPDCAAVLACGTDYVFRAFAHADSTHLRSAFTPTLTCSTAECENPGGCTLTQGFWKTHGPTACVTGNNTNEWPAFTTLTLGTVSYTDAQLCSILNQSTAGNGLVALAHQLIAAKLNIADGADGSAIATTIAAADAAIGSLVVPPVGSGALAPSSVSPLVTALDDYNNGVTGPGHCDDQETPP
jgi:hypothetical protein